MSRIFISGIFGFGDLGGFCNLWLQIGRVLNADFDGSYGVDFQDYRMMAEMWLKLCPVSWPLKD